MNAQVESIGRMAALQQAADRNGWEILRIEANRVGAIALFDRGRSPYGLDNHYGTAEFHFLEGYFARGEYHLTYEQAQESFRDRCNRAFPV